MGMPIWGTRNSRLSSRFELSFDGQGQFLFIKNYLWPRNGRPARLPCHKGAAEPIPTLYTFSTLPMRTFFLLLFFACFGITCEVFFVAFTNFFTNTSIDDKPLWALAGMSYVWMAPIYMLIPIIAGFLFKKMRKLPLVARLLIYTTLIWAVEFVAGFLLDQLTGSCPWEYKTGWHIMGYIRLDYGPAWMFFAWCVESLYVYLDDRL